MVRRPLLPACDRPFHDVPGLVPGEVQQAGTAEDIGLPQHVDGMSLERDGEPSAGQGPRDGDLLDAMHATVHAEGAGVQPGPTIAMIEVSPPLGGDVVIERGAQATFGTSEERIPSMSEPDVELTSLGVERDPLHLPGFLKIQEFGEDINITHGTGPCLCQSVH
jgi:hypothetical protein